MSYVRLQKLRAVENPVAPPGVPSTYPYGRFPQRFESLPVDYWFEGWIVCPPIVGKRVAALRLDRNGLRRPGVFWSTQVTAVEAGHFRTKNSVYKIAEVMPFADDDLTLEASGAMQQMLAQPSRPKLIALMRRPKRWKWSYP
jgi:hypothetical protein